MGLRAFFTKVKKNLADLIATGLFAASSVLMAASNPAVTIAITACSIATSIYFDCTHTRDKRRLFDELKARISLGKEIAEPSRTMEMVRYGGTLISLVCLGVYILLSSSGATIASGILEVSTGLAVLTCHIGRKIYDSRLGSGLHEMEKRMERILDDLEVGSGDRDMREHLKYLMRTATMHEHFIGKIEHFLQEVGEKSTEEVQRFLQELVRENRSENVHGMDSSARTLVGLRSDEVSSTQVEVITGRPSSDVQIDIVSAPVPTFTPPPVFEM